MKSSLTPQPPPFSPFRRLFPSASVLLLLFSLGYIAGFLSATTSPPNPQQQPLLRDSSSSQSPENCLRPPPPPHDLLRFRAHCADPIPQTLVIQTILDRLFNGSSPYAGFPSRETASFLLPPAARPRGWGSTNPVFSDLISSLRPLTIIELGSFLGASALHMASLTHNLSLPSLILCLDDFRGWPDLRRSRRLGRHLPPIHHADSLLLQQFMANVAAAGESGRIVPVPFSTSSALAALCNWGVYGDLIEVDAGHDFHSAWSDINMAYAVLRPGGVLFGHDYHTSADERGVRRAVTLFAKVNGLNLRAHGEHWVLSSKPKESVSVELPP
ncbi:hypothetical protein AXF42_Ash013193 [Apostasia shenzhenica]|uniref:Uncharacterized protein n=1 Tax=Apostasia shenzhenica TaxID=1088818 RepID=A0A2I0BDA6_9ASPA|nr:hypothetical protein AXF42_Ash013193 [Apostasia shenzhenica]